MALSAQFANGQMKPNWKFRNELLANLISPQDTIYIQDRHNLEKFIGFKFTDTTATISYQTTMGDKIFVLIKEGKFEPTKHKLNLSDTVYKFINNKKQVDYLVVKNLIDDKQAFGIDGVVPNKEFRELKIKWDDKWLTIPDSSFKNLYEIHPRTLETYVSKDKKLIYLYISGSDGAGGYSIKFVFDKTGFKTRLISTNECTDGYDFLDALPIDCE